MAVTRQPAKWFRDSVARGRANDGAREAYEAAYRDAELAYLRQAVIDMRRLATGYEARDGFSLKRSELARLGALQLAKLKGNVQMFRREMSQPHIKVRARTKAQREALDQHTGAKNVVGRKFYIVHVEKPETTKIKIEVPKRGFPRVVEQRKFGAVTRTAKYFYFDDYGPKPVTFSDVAKIVPKMLEDMPEGHYVFVSSNYGAISTWMEKSVILRAIRSDWMGYDKFKRGREDRDSRGLAETLVGFKFVGTSEREADRESDEREKRRRAATIEKARAKARRAYAKKKARKQ